MKVCIKLVNIGEEIDIRGPSGGIKYLGHGKFEIDGEEYHFDKVSSSVRQLVVRMLSFHS